MFRRGLIDPGYYAVPGVGAPLDQYGNIPAAFVKMILSYLGYLNEGNMNQSTKNNLIGKKKKVGGYQTITGVEYFVSRGKNKQSYRNAPKGRWLYDQEQHLAPGIYSRTGLHGSQITPIIMFVQKKKPYRKYIDLYGIGLRVLDRNKDQFFANNLLDSITNNKTFERFLEVS